MAGAALEVKVVEGLSGGQPRLDEIALDATAAAFGDLLLGDDGEEAGRRPTFLIGLFGELWPQHLDGGRPQLVEQQIETRGVDGLAVFMRRLRSGWRR